MKEDLKKRIESHELWLNTIGKEGEQLYYDEADLSKSDLSLLNLTGSILVAVNFQESKFINTKLYISNLASSDFSQSDLTNASLSKSNLDYTKLINATLRNVIAFRATFLYSNLKGADLTNADLRRTLFHEANFKNAILDGANLENATITGCCFSGASLKDVKGLESVKVEWIDIGKEGSPKILKDQDAMNWLKKLQI